MEILLVAATPFEIAPTRSWLDTQWTEQAKGVFAKGDTRISILLTGVGMVATTWQLGLYLGQFQPDWVLNAGVAGAFDRSFALGDVVQVVSECFGDLGVEEADGRFTDLFELGLCERNSPPFVNGLLHNPSAAQARFLPPAHGITVNRVHGYGPSVTAVQQVYPKAQVESMEGAAVFYSCLMAGVPFSEIRSISNYVEPRNRAGWQLGLAIEQLNLVIIEMLRGLSE